MKGKNHMSKRYTKEEKENALYLLLVYSGNIARTSDKTGIPQRTLRHWRARKRKKRASQINQGDAETAKGKKDKRRQQQQWDQYKAEKDSAVNELKGVRQQIMQHIRQLSSSLSDDEENVSQRAMALSRLLDRTLKLDEHIARLDQSSKPFMVEYIYGGKSHDVPPWENEEHTYEYKL
jgi:transposase-like protein